MSRNLLAAGAIVAALLIAAGTWLLVRCPDRTTFDPAQGLPQALHRKASDLLITGELPGRGTPDRGLCPLIHRCLGIVRSWHPSDQRGEELRSSELAALEEFDRYRRERDSVVVHAKALPGTNAHSVRMRRNWEEYEAAERGKLVSLLKRVDLLALSLPVR
jgi:hypothetical protein